MSVGLIGIIASDTARFSEFGSCLSRLQAPEGWAIEWIIGSNWRDARNNLVELTLEHDYSHLWFMDDDHSFGDDILLRLLAHDVALVNPICLARTWPFIPCVYPKKLAEGEHVYLPLDFEGAEPEGLIEIAAGGCAGMLIRRDVLQAVSALPGRPFEYGDLSEDITFCEKAKACGFTLYADLGVTLGHITTAVIQPSYDPENDWTTGFTVGKDMRLVVPFWSQMMARQEQLTEELPAPQGSTYDERHTGRGDGLGIVAPESEAERIEIWMGDETPPVWYWRALGHDGSIIWRDHTITEEAVIAQADLRYPGVMVHMLQSEFTDSRNLQQFGPPQRLWNRGN